MPSISGGVELGKVPARSLLMEPGNGTGGDHDGSTAGKLAPAPAWIQTLTGT